VADIEAGRRLPSADLKQRIAATLGISAEELAAADVRLTKDLRDWIEERPQVISILRALRGSPDGESLIRRLGRIIGRRTSASHPQGFLVTWESELRAIAAEAAAWSTETGGDLFGRWHDLPTVLLATKAGPKAQRDHAHFRLDVEYLRELSEPLATNWGLRYFGDWHSHHKLGLSAPSGGDRRRIVGVAARNQFANMAEIIVTIDEGHGDQVIRIHPWIYDLSGGQGEPLPLRIKVLPGLSPVRQALIAQGALPEQDWRAWERVPLQRIRIGADAKPPVIEPASDVDSTTREMALGQLAAALAAESGEPVERHATGFGAILVAKLEDTEHLAFALASAWPMRVLEIDRMNRADASTVPIHAPADVSALEIERVLQIYRSARPSKGKARHVES
jgi:hypothetical protein